MDILRDTYPTIQKKRITSFIDYNKLPFDYITILLNQVIQNYTYSTFDLIELVKERFQGNMKEAIESIPNYSNVRFNCYYAARLLKEMLSQIGIEAKYVSYKSIGFSSGFGDELIKEAHISLVVPTIRDGKSYYIILDPGYRIPTPMGFYASSDITNIKVDHDEITIQKKQDTMYPYCMKMKGYNRYSFDNHSYFCEEYFNCDYETLNPEEILFPLSFEILNGYRTIRFHSDKRAWAMLKVMILEKYLQCYDCNQNIILSFSELQDLPKEKIYSILQSFCDKLHQDVFKFVELLYFMIEHNHQFTKEVLNKRVLKEFQSKSYL